MKRILIAGIVFGAVALVAYLSTLGCCQLIGKMGRPTPLSRQLQLTSAQRERVAPLEREFLAVKAETCSRLCQKRAQLIQLLKSKEADAATSDALVEEIGREQIALEKATLAHLLALRQVLEPAQVERLMAQMTEELRTACSMTACGMTPGCAITGKSSE